MGKMKTHDHYANQRGFNQPNVPKKAIKVNTKPTSPGSKAPRQAEEATSPGTDSSNGG
jgi:hypothetical protein